MLLSISLSVCSLVLWPLLLRTIAVEWSFGELGRSVRSGSTARRRDEMDVEMMRVVAIGARIQAGFVCVHMQRKITDECVCVVGFKINRVEIT